MGAQGATAIPAGVPRSMMLVVVVVASPRCQARSLANEPQGTRVSVRTRGSDIPRESMRSVVAGVRFPFRSFRRVRADADVFSGRTTP
jgi:hypothetical protein